MDKFKTCKGCPDRKLHCHSTCEGYIERCKKNEERREEEHKVAVMRSIMYDYKSEVRERCCKHRDHGEPKKFRRG